jgi:hypothetical protein
VSKVILKSSRKPSQIAALDKKTKETKDVVRDLDDKILNQISREYVDIQTNIDDVTNLIERRKQHILKLGSLYEKRIQLGTLPIKINDICRQVYKDLNDNSIPFASYRTIVRHMPGKWKKPYHFQRIKDDIDEEGNPTGNNVEITNIVNPDKHTLSTEKLNLPNLDDLSEDGTPFQISQLHFDDMATKVNELEKATKNLDYLHPTMVAALAEKIKPVQEAIKDYADWHDIPIEGESKKQTTSVSLNMKKPPYRKNMVGDEVGLLQKDFAVIKKSLYHMVLTPEEEMFFWEAVRALRLFIRPHVNEKYKRNWSGYCKIMKQLENKNISGVAKRDTLSPAKVYDPEKGTYVYMSDLENEMNADPSSVQFKIRMKGITRNHLRNMSDKLEDVFMAFMTDMPFLADLCQLFETKLEPLRNAKACMISDSHS